MVTVTLAIKTLLANFHIQQNDSTKSVVTNQSTGGLFIAAILGTKTDFKAISITLLEPGFLKVSEIESRS